MSPLLSSAMSDFGSPDDIPPIPSRRRVSVMAVCALVFALLGCVPGFGAVATIFGGVALVSIASARGRLSGKGLAVTGIILGILTTALWAALLVGANKGNALLERGLYANGITPAFEHLESTAEPAAEFRPLLDASIADRVSDEQILAFRDEYLTRAGPYKGKPPSAIDMIGAWFSVRVKDKNAFRDATIPPMPVLLGDGRALVLIQTDQPPGSLDEDDLENPSGRVRNLGLIFEDGSALWLIDPTVPQVDPEAPLPGPVIIDPAGVVTPLLPGPPPPG